MERKKIISQIYLNTDMFMTSFDESARLLMKQKEKLEKEGWTNIHLKMVYWYDGAELRVYGTRLENDTEFNKRKEAEERELKAELLMSIKDHLLINDVCDCDKRHDEMEESDNNCRTCHKPIM